jgi:hypothetical protein
LDVAGPFVPDENGFKYVIVATEYRSRYALTEPVRDHTAATVADVVWRRIVGVFGPFRELLVDGAPEMRSTVLEWLLRSIDVKSMHPTAFRPAMMGLVERFK